MLAFLGIVTGILRLTGVGTALVAGATRVAARLGISPMLAGLTIVGFGSFAVPSGGISDIVFSLALTALPIPIFVVGKAKLGRTSGIMLQAICIACATYRINFV